MLPPKTDEELATRLRAETRFARLVHVRACASTQQLAADDPDDDDAVFWADHQTAGRGRQQRRWDDEPNKDLTATFRMRLELDNPVALPAIAPLCVLQAISPVASHELALKWPNDVFLDGRKLAGVLIDRHADTSATYLVGIGVNVNRTRIPRELEGRATSLALATGRESDRHRLLLALAVHLHRAALALGQNDEHAIRELESSFRERLGLMDRDVRVDAGSVTSGRLAALDFRELVLADGRRFPLGQVRSLRLASPE